MRIAVISNMVDPNVTPIYERLAAADDCELLVLYETAVEPNRRWEVPELGFEHAFLKSMTIDLRRFHPDAFLHLTWGTNALLKRFAPDIVVARGSGIWSSPANISAFLHRRRNGWTFVPWWESFGRDRPTIPRRIAGPWIRFFLGRSDAILACGRRAASYLRSLGVSDEKVVIAPHALPVLIENGDAIRARQRAAHAGKKRLLFVGQLIPRKGVDVLLEAFESIDDAELWIAGDGELHDVVVAAAAANDDIKFLGHLPKGEVQALYPQVDVLVVPSRYEVWGLVVDEAQAFGLPAVVSDQVGAADDLIVEDVTGKVVPAGDAAALATAIELVCAWPDDKLAECAISATANAASRSVEVAVDAYFELRRFSKSAG